MISSSAGMSAESIKLWMETRAVWSCRISLRSSDPEARLLLAVLDDAACWAVAVDERRMVAMAPRRMDGSDDSDLIMLLLIDGESGGD